VPLPKQLPSSPLPATGRPVLLYTGTISRTWGIFRAIGTWQRINKEIPTDLVVAGFTFDTELLKAIEEIVSASGLNQNFFLIGGYEYVPFEMILSLIQQCTAGLAFYRIQDHIRDRIPTKFYEFMAAGKPLFFSSNPAWNEMNNKWNFGTSVEFPASDDTIWQMAAILRESGKSKPKEIPPEAWSWAAEEPELISLLDGLWES